MKNTRLAAIGSGVLLVCLVAGCQKGAATPKEAVQNCFKSVQDGDKSAFLNSTTGLPPEEATALFEVASAAADFQKRFQSAYGADALGQFIGGARLPTAKEIESAQIKQDGNTATASIPALEPVPFRLRKEKDRWYVDLSALLPAGADTKMLAKLCKVAAKGINDTKGTIGKEGVSSQAVMTELGQRVVVGVGATLLADSAFARLEKGQTPAHAAPAAGLSRHDVETIAVPAAPGGSPPADTSPREKIAYAQHHIGTELLLVRRHPWSKVPGGNVQAAVRKVFGIAPAPAGGPSSVAEGVDFGGLTTAQVKNLIGNPSSKSASDGQTVWTYAYKGTELSSTITFRQDKAVRTSWSASPAVEVSALRR